MTCDGYQFHRGWVDELIKEYQQITQKLLSKLEFQKNMCVTLLILLYIGRFVHIEFLACSWKTFESAKTRNLPEIFFLHYLNEGEAFLHSIVTTDETSVYLKPNVSLWSTNINITFLLR